MFYNFSPCFRGTERLFSVKYLFGEANIALDFLLLEDGYKKIDERNAVFRRERKH